ncbi:MAG: Calx-beta domain-containing protein [Geminicoccaceae bacterium]
MMRMAGLVMIVLGLVGLGMTAFDWETMFEPTVENQTASDVIETVEKGAAADQDTDIQAQGENVEQARNEDDEVADAAEDGAVETSADESPSAPVPTPEIAQPSEPEPKVDIVESGPASVKVFERDEPQDQTTPTLWAEISAGKDVVDEDSGHAHFLVTLSEPADRSVVIIFSTVDLSANDREDYESQRGTVTFEPGVVSAEIKTPLVDDDIKEDDEQFAIVLNGAPGIVSFKSRRITTTIRDND